RWASGDPFDLPGEFSFSRDGTLAAHVDALGTILVWAPPYTAPPILWDCGVVITRLRIAPDGKAVAIRTMKNELVVWDVKAKRRLHKWGPEKLPIELVAFSPDGRLLAALLSYETGGRGDPRPRRGQADVVLWDMKSYRELGRARVHERRSSRLVF